MCVRWCELWCRVLGINSECEVYGVKSVCEV